MAAQQRKPRLVLGLVLALVAIVAMAAAIVIVPALLLQPFEPQTPSGVATAYWLRRISPWATLALVAAGALVAAALVRRTTSRAGRVVAIGAMTPLVALAWLSRQNHFEWMFHPLAEPRFVEAWRADVDPCDMVLAVVVGGEARAYPVRLLANHHVVNDVIAGRPITATY